MLSCMRIYIPNHLMQVFAHCFKIHHRRIFGNKFTGAVVYQILHPSAQGGGIA